MRHFRTITRRRHEAAFSFAFTHAAASLLMPIALLIAFSVSRLAFSLFSFSLFSYFADYHAHAAIIFAAYFA